MDARLTYIGCDLGGTTTKVAVVGDAGVLAHTSMPSQAQHGLRSRLAEIADTVDELCEQADVEARACAGLLVAVPGLVDRAGRRVTRIHQKFEDATEIDIDAWARVTFGIGAVLENDARAATIGEWQFGAGLGADDIVMITLGTGIGVGVIADGRVLRGSRGAAGVLGGHLRIELHGRRCMCGQVGCAEAEASSWALTEFTSLRTNGDHLDYERLAELRHHDARLQAAWEHSIEVWSALLVDLAHAYDPGRIIIGGGIASNQEILTALAHALDGDPWSTGDGPTILPGELGDDAATLAAPWLIVNAPHLHRPAPEMT